MVRINKFLAMCNVGSRRKVEQHILDGKIVVNDKIITELSFKVDSEKDIVKFDGKILKVESDNIYLMLNKPPNYLVTSNDEFGRKTVFDLVPDFNVHLFAIGRLDYQSEGLLLLTNDGDFANQIIHPRYKLSKLYKVTVSGKIDDGQMGKLRTGIVIDGKKTKPAIVFKESSRNDVTVLKITIHEGRKRQIRRMLKSVNSKVVKLKRLQIGSMKLGNLPIGMWRILKPNEIASLKNIAKKGRK